MWTISLFRSANRCLILMVTCMLVIYSQCCNCQAPCSDHKVTRHFSDYPIKKIHLDNAGEFIYKVFDNYCMSVGIEVEHPIAHVHTQNGLA